MEDVGKIKSNKGFYEEEDYSYYEDQLQEIYEATLVFAQEAKAVGFDNQAKQLDNVLDMLDHIDFNK